MSPAGPDRKLRLGVAGLGRAFTIMLPTFVLDDRVGLIAAADPRSEARAKFAEDFKARTYRSVEELCSDPEIEVVYVATPHHLHAAHVCMAAAAGKHILVEKPLAVTLPQCQAVIDATDQAGVHLVVGHSHSFNAPYRRAREIVASGDVGKLGMVTAVNFTDFMYRPRRPEELVTAQGGGVVFSQGAHQIDIVRLLGGGRVRSVRSFTGMWDAARAAEGAYSALLDFEHGGFATAIYSGYGHFDSDEFCSWIGELGSTKDRGRYGAARKALATVMAAQEAELKAARNYGGVEYKPPPPDAARLHQHFGVLIVSCEHADLRPTPEGVMIYGDSEQRLEKVAVRAVPRAEVIDELYEAVVAGRTPLHTGRWAMATLEVCLAILRSASERREIVLEYQIGWYK
jgi:phthalate 4,5-cis-dihydrodiol dehydrogenase